MHTLPEPVIYNKLHPHTNTNTCYFLIARQQSIIQHFIEAAHMTPDMLSSALRPAVGHTDFCTYAGGKKKCTSGLNQRSVAYVSSCLLVLVPAVAVGCFYALYYVPDIGGKLPAFFMWRTDVCRVGGGIPHPFWEAVTLNTKGCDRLPSAASTFRSCMIDRDPETHSLLSILFFPLFRVCASGDVWVC